MKILILFFVITIIGIRGVSQPDTMIYKKQIENLTDHASMQMYLDTIFKRDTNYRGNEAITLLDLENLISISYYFNAFGIHQRKILVSSPWRLVQFGSTTAI